MAYIKTDWVDNQTAITAARMNNIEDGIANNETAITQVETRIGTLSGIGQPIIATSADAMTDTEKIYLYVGSEEGYESGHWYYYDTEWVDGGEYGAGATGISNNARNLLKYILERVAYTEQGMQVYVDALYQALAESGGGGGTTTYTIINALTNVTNSNDATGCDEGDSYTGTLTPATSYTIDSVTVTMGGNDITSTAYDSSTGVITISSVTGDVVITAIAIASPYVTNGLIAYWDGINNTGEGHDSTATTWVDLVGGYDLIQKGTTESWGENALVLTGTKPQMFATSSVWTFPENATIEVVCQPNASQTASIAQFDIDTTVISGSQYYDVRRVALYSDGTIGFVGKSGNTYTSPVTSTSIRTLTAIYSNFTVTKALANNTQLSLSNKTHSLSSESLSEFRVGACNLTGNGAYPFAGKIYAIRVYNRALTDAELTQNFNADNTRFSLGL